MVTAHKDLMKFSSSLPHILTMVMALKIKYFPMLVEWILQREREGRQTDLHQSFEKKTPS